MPPLAVPPVVVVAAAIVRDGRVLACRRRGGAHDGEWEFPGGKVEPGEDEVEALRRECREELAVEITVGGRVGEDTAIAVGVLKLWTACTAGDPMVRVHDAARWVGAKDIDALPWIAADRELVAALRALLG